MQLIARIRVYTNRIPQVLVKVCFYKELSGNMEERPTRHDYIEIITNRAIFYTLEDSEEAGRSGRPRGANPRASALAPWPIWLPFADLAPPTLRINLNHIIKVGLIQRPTFI